MISVGGSSFLDSHDYCNGRFVDASNRDLAAAARNTARSSNGRATKWIPVGMPLVCKLRRYAGGVALAREKDSTDTRCAPDALTIDPEVV